MSHFFGPLYIRKSDGSRVEFVDEDGNLKIDQVEIPDGSISTAKLENDAVTEDKLADDAVSTDKIVDDAVTFEKVGTTLEGGVSNGLEFALTRQLSGDFLDGTLQTLFEVPAGSLVHDIILYVTDGASTAATVNIGTAATGWEVNGNDADAFVAA